LFLAAHVFNTSDGDLLQAKIPDHSLSRSAPTKWNWLGEMP
jgi:hypothetical protein